MSDMRRLINLMEGVEAVPALSEKSTSEKQARFMAAAAHNPEFAKKAGIEQDVAKEFNKADKGTKQLSNAMKKEDVEEAHVDTCRQENDVTARDACAMEGVDFSNPETWDLKDLVAAFRSGEISNDEYEQLLSQAIKSMDISAGITSDEDDYADWSMRQGEMGNYAPAVDEGLDNGYKDINIAAGSDFFPNGADGPVVKKVGPSGAKQGDNPEQKKMQVDEAHKELVYAYRKFVQESKNQKKS